MYFFFDEFPIELIIRLMKLFLASGNEPLPLLFNFLEAFPQYSNEVLLVSALGESPEDLLKIGAHAISYPIHFKMCLKDHPHFTFRDTTFGTIDYIGHLREIRTQVKILLMPNFAPLALPWSRTRFPSSTLAKAIECCDAVVAGAYEHELEYTTLKLIKEWSRSASTIFTVHQLTGARSLIKRTREYDFEKTVYFIDTTDPFNTQCLSLIGYQGIRYLKSTCRDLKIVIPDKCRAESITEPCEPHYVPLSKDINDITRLYIEFHCCRIPFLDIRHYWCSYMISSFVLENANWSPSNPFGKPICEHGESIGCLNQADYVRIPEVPNNVSDLNPIPLWLQNVTLIGVTQEELYLQRWEGTITLVWKRLESREPIRRTLFEEPLVFFKYFKWLTLEGTSNDSYHGMLKVFAPSMERLHITMLSESTRIWDLEKLLLSSHKPRQLSLKYLRLESNRVDDTLSLRFRDIRCVSRILETLWMSRLRPLFLEEIGQSRNVGAVFQRLISLRLDISTLVHKSHTIPLDGTHYPLLQKLMLEFNSKTSELYGSRSAHVRLDRDMKYVQFIPIPKELWSVSLDRGLAYSCKIVINYQLLEMERLFSCKDDEWAQWTRWNTSSMDVFRFAGCHRAFFDE